MLYLRKQLLYLRTFVLPTIKRNPMKKILLFTLLFFNVILNAQPYCDPPLPSNPCSNGVIGTFTLANISKTGTCDTLSTGYQDYTSDTVFLEPTQAYTATIISGDPLFADVYYAFIDWNLDYAYTEDERIVFSGVNDASIAGANLYQAVITVPPTAVTDSVGQIRVMGSWGGFDDNLSGCNNNFVGMYTFGEVEDYSFNISTNSTTTPPPTNGYCAATGGDACSDGTDTLFISSVTLEEDDATNVALNSTAYTNTTSCDGYANYSQNTDFFAAWSEGKSYQISVDIENDAPTALAAVYIDFNNDMVFDTEEEFDLLPTAGLAPRTALITVPSGAASGLRRMRVRVNGGLNISPCDSLDYGEVEDYTVMVAPPLTEQIKCATKISPVNGDVNVCTMAELMWNEVANATGYLVTLTDENGNVIYNEESTDLTSLSAPNEFNVNTKYAWGVVPFNETDTASGCLVDTFITALNKDPKLTLLPVGDTVSVCKDIATQLNANVTGGTVATDYSHSWNGLFNNYLNDTAISNPLFTSDSLGVFKYDYSVQDDNGCGVSDSMVLKVIEAPVFDTVYALNTSACFGDDIALVVKSSAGQYAVIDSVDGTAGWNISTYTMVNDSVLSVSGLSAGEVILKVKLLSGACEIESEEIRVSINAELDKPMIVASSTTFCQGDEVILSVSNYTDNLLWNDAQNTANDTLIISQGGTYNVTYTNSVTGCSVMSDDITITENQKPDQPTVTFVPSKTICEGDSVMAIVSNFNDNLIWNDVNNTQNDTLVIYETTVDLQVVYTDANGCNNSSTTEDVIVNALPAKPVINAPSSTEFCEGDVLILTVSNYNDNLVWNDANSTTGSSISVTETSTLFVTYVNPNTGCESSSDEVTVSFNAKPDAPEILAPNGLEYCEGEEALVYVTNYANNIVWNDVNSTANDSLVVTESVILEATFTDNSTGCSAISEAVNIVFNPVPEKSELALVGTTQIECKQTADAYKWFRDGEAESFSTQTITPTEEGLYQVITVLASCESDTSDALIFVIDNINDLENSIYEVYPNPVSEMLYINGIGVVGIEIYDLNGKLIVAQKLNEAQELNKIELGSELISGTYSLKIQTSKAEINRLISIQK